jgi:hypothetical protein
MHDMSIQQIGFGDRPLRELVIPGSHDAGTFVMESSADNFSSKCQKISILEQLKAGSRYLDLRAREAKRRLVVDVPRRGLDACQARGGAGAHQDLSRSVDR